MTQKVFTQFSWATVIVSVVLSILAWGQGINWEIGSISAYQWFPLFGLIAWMVMATHYFTGFFRIKDSTLKKPRFYEKTTAYLVLASLLLHPGILAYVEWRNSSTLPPASFTNYVGESLMLAVFLGSISLTLFLSYEVFDRLRHKGSVQKYWWLVSISQTVAMTLIFVHALRLGGELEGWFLIVWFLYGLLLLPCFYLSHKADFDVKRAKPIEESKK